MKNYSYKKTLLKGLKYFVLFALPFLVDKFIIQFPDLAQLTVGAFLVSVANWLKHYVGIKIP